MSPAIAITSPSRDRLAAQLDLATDALRRHRDAATFADAVRQVIGARWWGETTSCDELVRLAPGNRPPSGAYFDALEQIEADVLTLLTALGELAEAVR